MSNAKKINIDEKISSYVSLNSRFSDSLFCQRRDATRKSMQFTMFVICFLARWVWADENNCNCSVLWSHTFSVLRCCNHPGQRLSRSNRSAILSIWLHRKPKLQQKNMIIFGQNKNQNKTKQEYLKNDHKSLLLW